MDIDVGVFNFVKKGEDKEYLCKCHAALNAPDIAAFAVFDGHNGDAASKTCSKHLMPATIVRFQRYRERTRKLIGKLNNLDFSGELIDFLKSDKWADALLVEALRSTAYIMDGGVRNMCSSGTTVASVIARENPFGGARVLISNIGDSRCVLFAKKESKLCRSSSSQAEKNVLDATTKYHPSDSFISATSKSLSALMSGASSFQKLIPFVATRDHSLTSPSERARVLSQDPVDIKLNPFPLEVLDIADNSGAFLYLGNLSSTKTDCSNSVSTSAAQSIHEVDNSNFIEEHLTCPPPQSSLTPLAAESVPKVYESEPDSVDRSINPFENYKFPLTSTGKDISMSEISGKQNVVDEIGLPQDCCRFQFLDIPISKTSREVSDQNLIPLHLSELVIPDVSDDSEAPEGNSRYDDLSCDTSKDDFSANGMKECDRSVTNETSIQNMFSSAESTSAFLSLDVYIEAVRRVAGDPYAERKLAAITLAFLCSSERGEDLTQIKFSLDGSPIFRIGESKVVTPLDVSIKKDGIDIIREMSILKSRSKEGKKTGQEGLFGRFNLSVTMTRSIGCRYGPRRCIPLPDTFALDVSEGDFVRCVLASDGLWDVVSVPSVARVLNRYPNPETAAKVLTEKAVKKREKKRLRYDDITVLVIDIKGCSAAVAESSILQHPKGQSIVSGPSKFTAVRSPAHAVISSSVHHGLNTSSIQNLENAALSSRSSIANDKQYNCSIS